MCGYFETAQPQLDSGKTEDLQTARSTTSLSVPLVQDSETMTLAGGSVAVISVPGAVENGRQTIYQIATRAQTRAKDYWCGNWQGTVITGCTLAMQYTDCF